MNGLPKGEASSSSNPVLQFFCRSGEVLADIYEGTFKIDDITSLTAGATARVVSTAFGAAHKLGTGRYVIPTGDTSAWVAGTHRAVCTYRLAAGGPLYTQVILFEVLDSADWPTSSLYKGYVTTRKLLQDGIVPSTTAVATLHRKINTASRQVERWTQRFFEPRYRAYKVAGRAGDILHLEEAIIAIEKIESVYKLSDNTEQVSLYTPSSYQVYNRHLDGRFDDRNNPKIVLLDSDWPDGEQTVKVTGIFGYTDPLEDPTAGKTLIGTTPDDIAQVVGILVSRDLADPTLSDASVHQPGSVKSYKTRDQSVTFGAAADSAAADSLTGDPLLDQRLARFGPPLSLTYAHYRRGTEPGGGEVVLDEPLTLY